MFSRFCVSAHLAFSHVSHFCTFHIYRAFRISHISRSRVFCAFRVSDSSRSRASHKLCTSRVLASFAHFVFQIPRVLAHLTNYAHLAIPHSSHISRISCSRVFCTFRVSDSSHSCASHKLCTSRDPTQFAIRALTYLAGFAFSRFSRISHSRIFRILTCATARLPGIHRIPFACPVLILQGPLVRISLGFTCVISHMSLHSQLCSFISLCVYITSPLYV